MSSQNQTVDPDAPKAMLVSLVFKFGTQSGQDADITNQVLTENEATKGSMACTRRKICKEAFKPLAEIRVSFRAAVDRVTIPWDIKGLRFCKPTSVAKVIEAKRNYGPQFDEIKTTHLLDKYDQWYELTKTQLGRAFKEDEFPSREELIMNVNWTCNLSAMPDGEAIRKIKDIDDNLMAELVKSENDRIQKGIREGMAIAWSRMTAPLENMVAVLSGEKPKIHETLVTKVNDMIDQIGSINITDDPVLYEFASRARTLMSKVNVEDLRDDKIVRKAVADKATALIEAFGQAGKRRIAV